MRRLVVGDIQGCHTELLELLDRAGLGEDDEIVAVGDLVDRGPDSPAVLDFFRSTERARSAMGNHERKHLRWQQGLVTPALSQRITRRQFGEPRYLDALGFLAGLPHWIELPEAIVVHGFWEPGTPIEAQRGEVLVGTMSGETYLRRAYRRPWFELYDGPKPLVVGHHHYLGQGRPLVYRDRVYAIDTGCCFGFALTGLLLPEFRLLSVPARADHWRHQQALHADLRVASPDQLGWEECEGVRRLAVAESDAGPAGEFRRLAVETLERGKRALAALKEALERQAHEFEKDDVAGPSAEPARARRFAARVAGERHPGLLHLARKGRLTPDRLRRAFPRPLDAILAAEALGLRVST